MRFINRHLPDKFYLEADQRVDLRDKIFREVVGNCIVHREYISAFSTDLIISDTEVTITNPNKPMFHGPIDPYGFNPFPKNPNIRKFFTAFGWTDEIGSGIRNTNKYLPIYVPGAHPSFWENDIFRTEIPLHFISFGAYAKNIVSLLELPDESLVHIQEGLNKINLPASLKNSSWEAILLYLVPSWYQKGIKLTELNWPENQVVTREIIEKVPSWPQKGTEFLPKKAVYLLSILVICAEPAELTALMSWMEYKNRKTFGENYLKPLLQVGFIRRTKEESPRSPDQQYIITDAGKAFLAGS